MMQPSNFLAAAALLLAACALLWLYFLNTDLRAWKERAQQEVNNILAGVSDVEDRITDALSNADDTMVSMVTDAQREVEERIEGARRDLLGIFEQRIGAVINTAQGEVQERIDAALATAREEVEARLAAASGPLMERVRATVTEQFQKEKAGVTDLLEEAEDTITRLQTYHGKAIRAVRTAKTRLADLDGDDDEDDDEDGGGGMSDLFLNLAGNLPDHVRKGILDNAPPESRSQVGMLFAAADARRPAQQGNPAPVQQAPQAPEPTGFGI